MRGPPNHLVGHPTAHLVQVSGDRLADGSEALLKSHTRASLSQIKTVNAPARAVADLHQLWKRRKTCFGRGKTRC